VPLLTESILRTLGNERRISESYRFAKSAETILREAASTQNESFDVFLSHSVMDADLVLGVYEFLSRRKLSVYVDWLVDRHLDRANVNGTTAEQLRVRIRQSRSLIYAHSTNSVTSKWMPWELGYFDGFTSAVAILPITQGEQSALVGQEYLGLYPYLDISSTVLWVNRGNAPVRFLKGEMGFKSFREWLAEQRAAR
jgi:hypothetical protein